jgi:hypothetical protein
MTSFSAEPMVKGGRGRSALREQFGPDLLAIGLVFLAYTTTIWLALKASLVGALVGGAANTVPVILFGAAARKIIISRLMGRPLLLQAMGHLALCAGFSIFSLWLLLVLLGMVNGVSTTDFSVHAFSGGGMVWQALEDVTTYAVIAALTYARFGHPARPVEPEAAITEPAPAARTGIERSRFFVRNGEDIRPIDLNAVILVGGADDYAEVTTATGKHLLRMTLSDFERNLDPSKFARVHRSWIVNLDCVERVEPAGGGRMLLHMTTGHAVPASRTGARFLRNRVI